MMINFKAAKRNAHRKQFSIKKKKFHKKYCTEANLGNEAKNYKKLPTNSKKVQQF